MFSQAKSADADTFLPSERESRSRLYLDSIITCRWFLDITAAPQATPPKVNNDRPLTTLAETSSLC